jgi:hypothetical protein
VLEASKVKSLLLDHKKSVTLNMEYTLEEWAEVLIRLPRVGKAMPFSLAYRKAFKDIYNSPYDRKLLIGGRQVGKSLFSASEMLIVSTLIAYYRTLVVMPSNPQVVIFAKDKLASIVKASDTLLELKGGIVNDSVLSKSFANESRIDLRGAYMSADRIRTMTADMLYFDEFQDFLPDLIPAIEEVLSSAYMPELGHSKRMYPPKTRYLGTAKTGRDPLTFYYEKYSTHFEWAIPCHKHVPTHWNLIREENIGAKSLICDKCGSEINPNDDDAHWVSTDVLNPEEKTIAGWRTPQVMVPITDWSVIIDKRERYADQFYTDVLALPYESGSVPLTEEDMAAICDPNESNDRQSWNKYANLAKSYPVFAGLDWGPAAKSYTILSIGGYFGIDKFRYFFYKRYEGVESEPEPMLRDILQWLNFFNVKAVGADYGFGFGLNDRLMRSYNNPVFRFQHTDSSRPAVWDTKQKLYKLNRTVMMTHMIEGIKRKEFILPSYDSIPVIINNFLAIRAEYSRTEKLYYTHSPDDPDDAFHSSLYAFLIACRYVPRPEFFNPDIVNGDNYV